MKLEGSLDAFSLPDVFQLLSLTKKSGGLHLAQDGTDGVIFFADGKITGASADNSRQALARRLIGSGVVGDAALQAAVDRATDEDHVGVVKALLEAGATDEELLRGAVTEQVVDAVFDLLRWERGDFAFVMDEGNPDDVGVALPADTVLTDADARRETWHAVSQVIPSPTALLSMPVVLPEDPALSRDEWALLALVDGRRTVADLVDLTGCGQYAVVSTLAGLVQRSLLEVHEASSDGADHVSVVVRRQQLLEPLEDVPFTPVPRAEPVADVPAARQDEVAAAAPAQAAAPADASPVPPPAQPVADQPAHAPDEAVAATASAPAGPSMLGGAHVPGDVVPPRAEPFLPKRQPEYADARPPQSSGGPGLGSAGGGDTVGATALESQPALIERDPSVNRSLMLRLIAGVRGL